MTLFRSWAHLNPSPPWILAGKSDSTPLVYNTSLIWFSPQEISDKFIYFVTYFSGWFLLPRTLFLISNPLASLWFYPVSTQRIKLFSSLGRWDFQDIYNLVRAFSCLEFVWHLARPDPLLCWRRTYLIFESWFQGHPVRRKLPICPDRCCHQKWMP